MPQQERTATLKPKVLRVELHSASHIPLPKRGPRFLPVEGPLPRPGDDVFLTSSSLWRVTRVAHEFVGQGELAIHVVITHVTGPVGSEWGRTQ